jgi:transcriptional regulator with XRE-family HTH domain
MLLFWNNVKEELDYKDMSQKELSASTDISYNTLQSWITKDRLPDAQDAVKIARALNVSVEKLVTGKENISKDLNDEINSMLHDIRHLSTEDFKIAKTLIHRLSNQVRQY